jgi:hypothetical protein
MGFEIVWFRRSMPTFRRNMLSPYSGLKWQSSHFPALSLQSWRWIQHVYPKRWHRPTQPHVVKIQDDQHHDYRCRLPTPWRGTQHLSRRHTLYLNIQCPNRWIGRGDPQNWPLWSPVIIPLILTCGVTWVWTRSKQNRVTIASDCQCCKTHEMTLMFYSGCAKRSHQKWTDRTEE